MSDLGDAQWIHDGPPPIGPEPSVFEQEAANLAHIWHQMSDQAREVVRMCNMDLGRALDDLLETLVEDT